MKFSGASTFVAQFDAWCRGCNDDIFEGDEVGFVPGEKGIHCFSCVIDYHIETITKDQEQGPRYYLNKDCDD